MLNELIAAFYEWSEAFESFFSTVIIDSLFNFLFESSKGGIKSDYHMQLMGPFVFRNQVSKILSCVWYL